jgi:replication fork protection complex subunit Tof1/Swi1
MKVCFSGIGPLLAIGGTLSIADTKMLSVVGASKDGYYSEEERLEAAGPPDLLDDELDRFEIFMPAVQSLVNALGGYEELETTAGAYETIYRPGDSVLAVLKDLKKLWRKDDMDDERTVARCMARAGLMKELIALLVECTDRGEWGRKVALVACE